MCKSFIWHHRAVLGALLTEQLREVGGCQDATIVIGPSRDAGPGESNWFEFLCLMPPYAHAAYVQAVAGGVVSDARERFNVLDS